MALGLTSVAVLLALGSNACVEEGGDGTHALQIDGNTRFHISDRLGSASLVLDAAGRVVARSAQRPWGETWFAWQAADEQQPTYRFTGKPDDKVAGAVSIGVRNYLPALGRWTSPDPRYLFEEPSAAADPTSDRGLFRYAMNKPMDLVDPDGRDVKEYGFSGSVEVMGTTVSVSLSYVWDSEGSSGVAAGISHGKTTSPIGASVSHFYQHTLHEGMDEAQADSVVETTVTGGEGLMFGHTLISAQDPDGMAAGYTGSRVQVGASAGITVLDASQTKPTTRYFKLFDGKPVKPRRGDLGMVGNIYWKAVRPLMNMVGA